MTESSFTTGENIFCALAGWFCASLVAFFSVDFGMARVYDLEGAGGASFYVFIFTWPTLGVRALVPHEVGLVIATVIGAVVGFFYMRPIRGLFEPMVGADPALFGSTVLVFMCSGAAAGAVWWVVEWLFRRPI